MAGIETLKRAEFNLKEHAVITDYYKVYKEDGRLKLWQMISQIYIVARYHQET